jgi:small subunit ribosomal protein S16
MVKLRLKRFGRKGMPTFRLIAIHSTTRRQAIPLEELGFYDPRTKETRLNVEGIKKRLQEGAQPTDPVRRLLEKANILEPTPRG